MREIAAWKKELVKEFKPQFPVNAGIKPGRLCDIELGLYLWQKVAAGQDCRYFWTLLSGYPFLSVWQKWDEVSRQAVALARYYLHFYKSSRYWGKSIELYRQLPENVRLYKVDEDGLVSEREVSMCLGRKAMFERVLRTPPAFLTNDNVWAEPGKVFFWTPDASVDSVTIPAQWVDKRSEKWQIVGKLRREPLRIAWNELEESAGWMDSQLDEAFFQKQLSNMKLDLLSNTLGDDAYLSLNEVVHMVGMPSSGKSTLMRILAVWAAIRGVHITLIVDNVASVLELSSFLSRLGISATPILGASNRDVQLEKAHSLLQERGLDLSNSTELKWLSTVCALNGLRQDTTINRPFLPGQEPCARLYADDPRIKTDSRSLRLLCPVFERCPMHHAARSLSESHVWIATPASLVHTWVPTQLVNGKMRYWELVYRRSDLIVFDEADRVQVLLDNFFAPTQILADHTGQSWLNKLGEIVSSSFYSRGRRQLFSNVMNWYNAYNNVQHSIDLIYTSLLNNELIRNWVGNNYFTTWGLSDRLIDEISSDNPQFMGSQFISCVESFIKEPLATQVTPELAQAASIFLTATEKEQGHAAICTWLRRMGYSTDISEDLIDKISFIVIMGVLENSLHIMVEDWDEATEEFNLDGEGLDFFRNRLSDFQHVLPEAPMGNVFGFQYVRKDSDERSPGLIRVFRFISVGRWLMSHFPSLLTESDGLAGPATLLLSGTSWAPGSPAYHLPVSPAAILKAPEHELAGIAGSEMSFQPVYDEAGHPVFVSGSSEDTRLQRLRTVLKGLTDKGIGDSHLERELALLDERRRRVLLLVGSYAEARVAKDFFSHLHNWTDQDVCSLIRDNEEELEDNTIQRGRVEKFATTRAKILIAPMMAIERGHNILNEDSVAAFGSAYFLVRPMPVPNDMNNYTMFINSWAMKSYKDAGWLSKSTTDREISFRGVNFRTRATKLWQCRLTNERKNRGLNNWTVEEKRELYSTQLVLIWQIIGRLIRGGCRARVHFVDAAFHLEKSGSGYRVNEKSSMLYGFRRVLDPYFDEPSRETSALSAISAEDRTLAQALYAPLHSMLTKMRGL